MSRAEKTISLSLSSLSLSLCLIVLMDLCLCAFSFGLHMFEKSVLRFICQSLNFYYGSVNKLSIYIRSKNKIELGLDHYINVI